MAQLCPCGLTGDNCDELVAPLEDPSLLAFDELCNENGFEECIVNADEASCLCKCGHRGDLCEEPIFGDAYNVAFGMVYGALVVTISLLAIIWRKQRLEKQGKRTGFEYIKADFVYSRISSVSPSKLLLIRAVFFFGIYLPVLVTSIIRFGGEILGTYTYWNWTVFGAYNFVGMVLSYQQYKDPTREINTIGMFEVIYLALHQITLASSIFVGLIFWGVLVPIVLQSDGEPNGELGFNSFVVHGIILFFLGFEFYSTNLRYRFYHIFFLSAMLGMYLFFHTAWMMIRDAMQLDNCPVYPVLDTASVAFPSFLLGMHAGGMLVYVGVYNLDKCKGKKKQGKKSRH